MDRSVRRKKITAQCVSERPGPVGDAGGASPDSPRRSSNDWVRNDERMVGPRATSRAVKATRDQALLESDTERGLGDAPNSLIGMKESTKEVDAIKPR